MKSEQIEALISQWSREFGVHLTAVQHMGLQLALRSADQIPRDPPPVQRPGHWCPLCQNKISVPADHEQWCRDLPAL